MNGLEEKQDGTLESDDDADGQAVDPTRAKPKVRGREAWASFISPGIKPKVRRGVT